MESMSLTSLGWFINKIVIVYVLKDTDSAAPKRGSVIIGLMTSGGAIWFRYQRAALMR